MQRILIGGTLVVLFGEGGIAAWWMLDGNGSNGKTTPKTITLLTFNIQNLGRDKPDKPKLAAEIIKQFDVVAIHRTHRRKRRFFVLYSCLGCSGPL